MLPFYPARKPGLCAALLLLCCTMLLACPQQKWSSYKDMQANAVDYWGEDESGQIGAAEASLVPPGARLLKVNCAAVSRGKGASLLRMDYQFDGAPEDHKAFSYLGAGQDTSQQVDLGPCKVRFRAGMAQPKRTNNMQQKALVRGTYLVDVDLPNCEHVAWFEINEFGYLALQGQKVGEDFSVQLISTSERGLYLAYRVGFKGDPSTPLFGIEYVRNELLTQHDVTLADGWTYNFRIPDGTLRLYPPEALGTLPATLLATAAAEAKAREAHAIDSRNRGLARNSAACGG